MSLLSGNGENMLIKCVGIVNRRWKGEKSDGIDLIENDGIVPLVGATGTFDKIVLPTSDEEPPARVKLEGVVRGAVYDGKFSLKVKSLKIEQMK
jgi:hypothetical protein